MNMNINLATLNSESLAVLARNNVIDFNNLSDEILFNSVGGTGNSIFDIVNNENIFIEKRVSVLRKVLNTDLYSTFFSPMFVRVRADQKGLDRTNNRNDLVSKLSQRWGKLLSLVTMFNLTCSVLNQDKIRDALLSDIEYINKRTHGDDNRRYDYFLADVPAFCEPQEADVKGSERAWAYRVIAFHEATKWKFYDETNPHSYWLVREAAVSAGFLTRAQVVLDRSMKIRKSAAVKHGYEY